MIKTKGQVTHDSLHVLGISVHPILLSDWKDLALLDFLTMEQIIALQQFVSGINDAVKRLELQPVPVFPVELIEDLNEYYDGVITFIFLNSFRNTPMLLNTSNKGSYHA